MSWKWQNRQENEVRLFPALPKAWDGKEVSFKGLCARGGWMVDCEWKDGRSVKVELRPGSNAGPRPVVRFNGCAIH